MRAFFNFVARPNFAKTKRGASGGFLPRPLLLRLRHPNSEKRNQPKFPQNFVRIVSDFLVGIHFKKGSNFVQNIPPENEIGFGSKNMVGAKRRLF
jgi:hypothetical protein